MILAILSYWYYRLREKLNKILHSLRYTFSIKSQKQAASWLDPKLITKYVNQLLKPAVYKPFPMRIYDNHKYKYIKKHYYRIDIVEFDEQILPDSFPKTKVWGYGGLIKDTNSGKVKYSQSSPGATFEALRGIPVTVKWVNRLEGKHPFAVDPTLHWANPNNMPMEPEKPWPPFPPGFAEAQRPVPTVTHLHGGEVSSVFDGHPDAWFTYNNQYGSAYSTSLYTYPNSQESTTLWYHDHALGITRLNVYAGLAGFYILRDGKKDSSGHCFERRLKLPRGKYEIPIVIQDRTFHTDGSFAYANEGINPDIHPYWVPEFFGDTIMVNGKVWPNLNVERHQYRFRFLNTSNARFYNLTLSNGMSFIQIGSDGGFLPKPVTLSSLLIAPAERADLLIDFSCISPGTSIILLNDAKTPYPDGETPDPNTVGQIMQFRVPENAPMPVKPTVLPDNLNCIPTLIPDAPERILTLNEVMGPNGPVEILLNGQKWSAPITEYPVVGSTEVWTIVNLTMDTHPIHLHLVQFRLLNRQDFDMDAYQAMWDQLNGEPPLNHPTNVLPVDNYLTGAPIPPDENEMGWKDTIRMNPNQVTRIIVRFAPQDVPTYLSEPGLNFYPFNPSKGPGYVWHCHILDHEDNEMMRPYKVDRKC
jgi:spore coat protein A, manganese oxidase